jgi:hypothetical protein
MWLPHRCYFAEGEEFIPIFGTFGLGHQIGSVEHTRPLRFGAMLEQWVDSKFLVRDGKAKVDLDVYREIRMAEAKAVADSISRADSGTLVAATQQRILDRERESRSLSRRR